MAYRVQKWGNSNGIRIPKVFLEALNLKSGDSVSMVREEDKIIIKKIARPRVSLKQRIKDYEGPNECENFTWDEAKGKELW